MPPPTTHHLFFNERTLNRKGKDKVKREWMGSDVIQILPPPPPPPPSSRRNNNRVSCLKDVQVNPSGVIEIFDDEDEDYVVKDEDLMDVMILDEKIDVGGKGKGFVSDGIAFTPSKDIWNYHQSSPTDNSTARSNKSISIDDDFWSGGDTYSPEFMQTDDYAISQAHLGDIDHLPASVEAPVPWNYVGPNVEAPLPFFSAGPSVEAPKPRFPVGPSTGAPTPWTSVGPNLEAPNPWLPVGPSAGALWFSAGYADPVNGSYPVQMGEAQLLANHSALQKLADYKRSIAAGSSNQKNKLDYKKYVGSEPGGIYPNFSNKGAHVVPSGPSFYGPGHKFQTNVSHGNGHIFFQQTPMNITNNSGAAVPNSHGGSSHLNGAGGNLFFPNSHSYHYFPHHANPFIPPISWVQSKSKPTMSELLTNASSVIHIPRQSLPDPPAIVNRTPRSVDRDSKLQLFKRFDTVEDYSDHHYKGSSAHNAQKNWAKKIQDEWRILENDLPENIYVKAYETRIDILRAVIVGADGTPYHNGLFFFDIHFPPQYPNVPPLVYYHAGGLRLNPNLYANGKVCLSLLGTWSGNANESWIPSRSTALQVLVSIQALILNRMPYFNEPGYERTSGTPHGELQSEQYNESTFLLSLKTMTYTLRNPPKHFEDFVLGHFHKYAHVILVACRSYTDGARVGSLVEGGIRDVNETNKSCSECFKTTLPAHVNILAQEFMQIGVNDCESFCQVAKATTNSSSGSLPKKAAKE